MVTDHFGFARFILNIVILPGYPIFTRQYVKKESSGPVSRILFSGKPEFLSFIFAIYPPASDGPSSTAGIHDLATHRADSILHCCRTW